MLSPTETIGHREAPAKGNVAPRADAIVEGRQTEGREQARLVLSDQTVDHPTLFQTAANELIRRLEARGNAFPQALHDCLGLNGSCTANDVFSAIAAPEDPRERQARLKDVVHAINQLS